MRRFRFRQEFPPLWRANGARAMLALTGAAFVLQRQLLKGRGSDGSGLE